LTPIKASGPNLGSFPTEMYPRPNIHHRNLWSVDSLSRSDVLDVLETARRLKQARLSGHAVTPLRGCNLALLNDAPPADGTGSLRHAALDLGAQVSHLRPSESRIAPDAPDEATARMLGRLYDAIDCEAMAPDLVARVAQSAGVPVFNGLGSHGHPTRVLAELLNMQDQCGGKPLDSLSVCFVGDPRTPCGDALLHAAAATGMELRIAAPRHRWPPPELLERLRARAVARGERLRLYESADQAGKGTDIVVDAQTDPPWPMGGQVGADRGQYRQFTLQALLVSAIS
jgi:ornithine carbamoyltransferase